VQQKRFNAARSTGRKSTRSGGPRSVRENVVNWVYTALGWGTKSAGGAIRVPPAHAHNTHHRKGTEGNGTAPQASTHRWSSQFVVESDMMPASEQYDHHITRMLRERVPNVGEAFQIFDEAAANDITLAPHNYHRVLGACLDSAAPLPEKTESAIRCLRHLVSLGVPPDTGHLAATVSLLISDVVPSTLASSVVRLTLDADTHGVVGWSEVPNSHIDALVVKALDGEDFEPDRLFAILQRDTSHPLAVAISARYAENKMRQYRSANPPQAQDALNLYMMLQSRNPKRIHPSVLEDLMMTLCAGAGSRVDDGTATGRAVDGAVVAFGLLQDALATRHGVPIPLACQEAVLAATADGLSVRYHGPTQRQLRRLVWGHLSSDALLNPDALTAYRWLVQRLMFIEAFTEAGDALRAIEAKISAAIERPDMVALPNNVDRAEWDEIFAKYVGTTMGNLGTLALRSQHASGPTDATLPDRALKLFWLLDKHGPKPNELHHSSAINACAADDPPRVTEALALFEKLQGRTDLPQSESAWYATLKVLALAKPHAMATEALALLDAMLGHPAYPSPNPQHYRYAVHACLHAKVPRVADAATLLITAPEHQHTDAAGFSRVFSSIRAESARYAKRNDKSSKPPTQVDSAERRRLATVSAQLISRMSQDGLTPTMNDYTAALAGALDGSLASGADGLVILRHLVDAGVYPSRTTFTRVLEWCNCMEVALAITELMRRAGHTADSAVHLSVLKSCHRSVPPAWQQAVTYLLDLVRSGPQDPALYQAVIRACSKANPVQLDGALRLLALMQEHRNPPNFTTIKLLLRCCRRVDPADKDTAIRLWRELAIPTPSDRGCKRFQEACDELTEVVGSKVAAPLIAAHHSRHSSPV
jgi:hypothetical protein